MKASTLSDYKQRILRVLIHIQHHLDDRVSIDELARIACFSPFHFHRIFSGMIGESLKEHVRRLRLERAAIQLKLSRRPITQIAFDAGYDAHEAFTRAFKAVFGASPIAFRSKRMPALVAVPSGVHYNDGKAPKNFKVAPTQNTSVMVKTLKPIRVAFMRHVGPYKKVSATWDRLLAQLVSKGLIGGDCQFIGICHDDPDVTPSKKLRYDACVTIDKQFTPMDDIGVQTIPGGDYATTTHFGPYYHIGRTYVEVLGQWLPRSGREMGSCFCFESYLNSPENTEPEDLLTDIYVPLQPKS